MYVVDIQPYEGDFCDSAPKFCDYALHYCFK